jgi:Ca2+-binding RTX toxin-like protein
VSSERANRPARLRLGAAALALAVIGSAVAALAGSSDAAPRVELSASGPIAISNSLDGEAILSVAGLIPGETRSANVTIGNIGSAPGALELAGSPPQDHPGPNGGALSPALALEVSDVTAGSNLPVYTGRLSDLEAIGLPTLPPGDERTYRFAVTLPDGGVPATPWSGDNALQESSTRIDYEWSLTGTGTRACGNSMRGTSRPDRIAGTLAGDRIRSGGGGDRIRARTGNDCVAAQGGPDRIAGGPGRDRLRGGRGRDRIRGGPGADVVRCGPGRDVARVDRREAAHGCERVARTKR